MAIGKTFILILGENEPFPNTGSKHPAIFLKKVNPYLGKPTAILGFSDGYGNVFSSILTAEQGTINGDIADLNIANPSDGQVLTYSAASNTWVNAAGGGSSTANTFTSLSATSLSGGTIFSGTTDLSVTIGSKIDKLITFITTGSSYTIGATDNTKLISLTASTATTVMIPNNTAVTISNGTQILIEQNGAGQITFSGNAGVTLTSSGSKNKTSAQYSTASLIKKATNIWLLSGDITT